MCIWWCGFFMDMFWTKSFQIKLIYVKYSMGKIIESLMACLHVLSKFWSGDPWNRPHKKVPTWIRNVGYHCKFYPCFIFHLHIYFINRHCNFLTIILLVLMDNKSHINFTFLCNTHMAKTSFNVYSFATWIIIEFNYASTMLRRVTFELCPFIHLRWLIHYDQCQSME